MKKNIIIGIILLILVIALLMLLAKPSNILEIIICILIGIIFISPMLIGEKIAQRILKKVQKKI